MECKFDSSGFIPEGKGRINRNIVECKYEIIASFTGSETGINRNIVECKWGYNELSKAIKEN